MLEFKIDLIGIDELRATFRHMDEDVRVAVGEKLKSLTEALKRKVMDNVSGIILQKVTGALEESIAADVDVGSEVMEGFVVPRPADEKAFAHEFGGKGWYDIYPVNKNMLKFMGKEGVMVYAAHVRHPPAKASWYLRTALIEMEPQVIEGFQEVIDHVIGI